MLYGLLEKRAQNYVTVVRRPYGLYGPLNVPFLLGNCAVVRPEQKLKCGCTKSVQYGFILLLICLEIRALALPWNSCHFFAAFSAQKIETSLLLLSLNLSISLGKNDFSFGLFPPLESLTDS
jgi:hypothetical protein